MCLSMWLQPAGTTSGRSNAKKQICHMPKGTSKVLAGQLCNEMRVQCSAIAPCCCTVTHAHLAAVLCCRLGHAMHVTEVFQPQPSLLRMGD
jgi:hypothetical protein